MATVKKLPPPAFQQVGKIRNKPEGLFIKMRFAWPVIRGYRTASIVFIRRGGHSGGALEVFKRNSTDYIDRELFNQGRQFACDQMNDVGEKQIPTGIVLQFVPRQGVSNPPHFCETEAERTH